jgi:LAS superfamily LD-carboxypeptidase LdcB
MQKTSKIYLSLFLVILLIGSGFMYLFSKRHSDVGKDLMMLNSTDKNTVTNNERTKIIQKNTAEKIKKVTEKDKDLDGLSDEDEKKNKTNPENIDSDVDGLLDAEEVTVYHTDPLNPDTDSDGKRDGYEVDMGANPLKKDK